MTFRPMRRQDRQLSNQEAWTLLNENDHGILSVIGDEGWPYAVPMNYILSQGALYLHGAREGHKLDAIARDDRVCFTVVAQAQLVPDHITTCYESVVVFGRASLVEDTGQRQAILRQFTFGLGQVSQETGQRYMEKLGARTALIRIEPQHITAKANRRYVPVTQRI